MKRNSQIKMFETISILVVFFILVLFSLMFYTRVLKGTQQQEVETYFVLNAIELSQKIEFFPEISCTRDNIPEKGCIDILKLEASTSILNSNRVDYFDTFGFSTIRIQEIYPNSTNEWTLYDFPKNIDNGKIATPFPISIYNPIIDNYAFGVMYVDIYR